MAKDEERRGFKNSSSEPCGVQTLHCRLAVAGKHEHLHKWQFQLLPSAGLSHKQAALSTQGPGQKSTLRSSASASLFQSAFCIVALNADESNRDVNSTVQSLGLNGSSRKEELLKSTSLQQLKRQKDWNLRKGLKLSQKQNHLTQLVALFSFNFSLKYSVTFFSQSEFGTCWAKSKMH